MSNFKLWRLKEDGELKFTGTANDCYIQLHRHQGQSCDHALNFEGWTITEVPESEEFETGVTTAEANNLILTINNDAALADKRDYIFRMYFDRKEKYSARFRYDQWRGAFNRYFKRLAATVSGDLKNFNLNVVREVCAYFWWYLHDLAEEDKAAVLAKEV